MEGRVHALRSGLEALALEEATVLVQKAAEPVLKAGASSYKKRAVDRVAMFPKMLEEIEKQ
eukprot:3573260-Lingulodinium_polyedra.AAC.1